MTNPVSTELVWEEITKELFAVLGMVTKDDESRTVGIVYIVKEWKLYIGTGIETWKVRHITQNPRVSITIPIAKRIPFMPWFKIPQATISFSGEAKILPAVDVNRDLLHAVFRHYAEDEAMMSSSCLIEIAPQGDFLTYGIGVPLLTMRNPSKARGRAPVCSEFME